MTEQQPTVEELQGSLVESFMAIVGAPDDTEIADRADEIVRTLDARLAAA
ncbi:hypothetical protein GCM10010193_16050 [Kitasatospora atroaurantiaca]|uniref:Uncharacterized protein n=1 Tax=Kitasatospora atroaurantiaca TaxID=285545 RepID=A0A561EVF4_9ACTN|nr:hypothetical protein [Kitasatospora atroaurantiaca]TWE19589.1 hypothetical protein FB465_4707 [Kitasatospora atroaurantiaca]